MLAVPCASDASQSFGLATVLQVATISLCSACDEAGRHHHQNSVIITMFLGHVGHKDDHDDGDYGDGGHGEGSGYDDDSDTVTVVMIHEFASCSRVSRQVKQPVSRSC